MKRLCRVESGTNRLSLPKVFFLSFFFEVIFQSFHLSKSIGKLRSEREGGRSKIRHFHLPELNGNVF